MPKITWAELRADLLCIDWRPYSDRVLGLSLLASFLLHLIFWQVMRVMPFEEQWPIVVGKIELPPLQELPGENWHPEPPRIAEAAPPYAANNGPGTARPSSDGGASAAPRNSSGNLVDLLHRNQALLELLTSGNAPDGWAKALESTRGLSRLPESGVRVASRDTRTSLSDGGGPVAIATSMDSLLPMPGTLAIADRQIHKVISRVQAPLVATGDADSDRLIRHALRARMPAVKNCYEKALKLQRNLTGTIVLRLHFGENGVVQSAEVVRDSLGNAEVAACVAGVLQGVRTPTALGRVAEVQAPYVFTSVD